MGGWRNSPGLSPHCWVLQGAWLQHDIARLAGTEECEYRCPGWAWTASGCPKPIRTLPSLAMPPKGGAAPVSMSHPSCSAGSTVVWATGKGLWGECAGCFLSFPHEHQHLGMLGFQALGDPWLCSAPSLATRMGDGGCVVAGKEVGRSSCCGAGQTPIFLTQGPRAGLGRVLVLGLVLALRTTCTSVCSCSAPWICPPKAVWGDASVLLPA